MPHDSTYSSPVIVGVRHFADWPQTETVESVIRDLGQNTGNLFFTDALQNVLARARWAPYSFTEEDLEGCDAIILAAANWIGPVDDFGWLAERLESTQLPVFLIGIGAQTPSLSELPTLKPGTMRLLSLVQDRSKSIAARGLFTCDVLSKYGFTKVQPTGCPSLLMLGPSGPQISTFEPKLALSDICTHATRHMFHPTDSFQTYLFRQALKHDTDLVLQSELPDIYFALRRTGNEEIVRRAQAVLEDVYGTKDFNRIRRFLAGHGKIFINYDQWIGYLKTRSFCFGTRFHCTIAALIAGVPATLISHDSRTMEMAEWMKVPAISSENMDCERDICPANLVLPDALAEFVENYPSYYSDYLEYFKFNGLTVAAEFATNDEEAPKDGIR
ncbi:MAG: polysaccharide pyruvyl transferase family protein [Alphaproteobacteria bacterium]